MFIFKRDCGNFSDLNTETGVCTYNESTTCVDYCKECETLSTCKECSDSFILTNGLCSCDEKNNIFLKDGKCEACTIENCKNCSSLNTCSLCDDDYEKNETGGNCISKNDSCTIEYCSECYSQQQQYCSKC